MATNTNTNSSNFTVSDWNSELAIKLIPNDIILAMYLLLGISGNTLVILVYGFRMKKQSDDRYFIPILAISDLSASVVCASFGIALNMMQAQFTNKNLCKAWWFFAAFTTYMSILVLGIIAIHRYLKVCRPLGKQMNIFWKRLAVISAFCVAFMLGVPTTALYGSVDFPNLENNIVGRRCSKLKDVSKTGSLIYSGIAGIVMIVTITMLIVFYGKIGLTIYRHVKFISKSGLTITAIVQEKENSIVTLSESWSCDTDGTFSSDVLSNKTGNQVMDYSPSAQHSQIIKTGTQTVEHSLPAQHGDHNKTSTRAIELSTPDPHGDKENGVNISSSENNKYKTGIRGIKHSLFSKSRTHVDNTTTITESKGNFSQMNKPPKLKTSDNEVNRKKMYKFTIMFMIITIVFILCYIPKVLLLAMEGSDPKFWEKFPDSERAGVLFVYRSFIINNVINPFIYAFMDNKFRQEAISFILCSKSY